MKTDNKRDQDYLKILTILYTGEGWRKNYEELKRTMSC